VIVTDVSAATGLVVTENVAVVSPAATVTLAGACAAAGTLLVKPTTAPPAGAAPFSVTVPWEERPPMTLAGLRATEPTVSWVAVIVTVAAFEDTPSKTA
jgi:hypothetical protein